MRKKEQGFTLIEMMVVVSLIAIMTAVIYPLIDGLIQRLRSDEEQARVHAYAQALQSYYVQQLEARKAVVAQNIKAGAANQPMPMLLPDISGATDPYNAGVIAANVMVQSGALGLGISAQDLYNSTSNGSRQVALYIQQPDETGTDAGYVAYIQKQAPTLAPAPAWGKAYCPHKAQGYVASSFGLPGASKGPLAMALVISAGPNGKFDTFGGTTLPPREPTTPNWRAPGFRITGDDKGFLINFSALHNLDNREQLTMQKINRLASAASSYFRFSYTQAAFVAGTPVPTLLASDFFSGLGTVAGMMTNLGIPALSMADEFGNPIYVGKLKTTHPYTIVIYNLCGDFAAVPASAP